MSQRLYDLEVPWPPSQFNHHPCPSSHKRLSYSSYDFYYRFKLHQKFGCHYKISLKVIQLWLLKKLKVYYLYAAYAKVLYLNYIQMNQNQFEPSYF